jgi:ubiquinone/menaquinone biosynthesis C-methylase UbiE
MSSASSLRAKAVGTEPPRTAGAAAAAGTKPAAVNGAANKIGAAAAADAGKGARVAPFRARLHAWWHGLDTEDVAPPPAEAKAATQPEPEPEAPAASQVPDAAAWSEVRVKAAEIVVGDDCRTPIGPDKAVEALKPLGLTNAKGVIDISAGLGNAARQIAATYGAWVSGFESSACLAAQGMARSVEAGVAKKVPIVQVDLENMPKPAKPVDCVYGREAFYTVKNKKELLTGLVGALKTGGELVFTDYVLRAPGLKSAAVTEWAEGEPAKPQPWSVEEMIAQLRELRLDVRVTEDYSKQFRDLIVRRLEALVTKNELVAGDPAQAEQLLHEVELWGRRVKALDSGDVQVYRIYARKTTSPDGKVKAMSNW